ncbi:zf-HC2 domain-containing protein [Paenibacillus sp. MWE-103]|uniref:Zf-HC2 domain-containing protein n=1 Tax=Paenibacillus artemisiicola TaxID=1172618 RepID=A0ABS3W743_9BACL|nr:zf-HC2 domain-containing protein [Paenibacillus artemisiicola]MBO7744110.1 zf-HC2 domain-containing protein [Paenibacillus artemisiicola]
MNCQDVQESFGVYWDLAEDDSERLLVDLHLQTCEACREEFRIWEESEQLIRVFSEDADEIGPVDHVNHGVMDRIYSEQSWFMPVTNRTYQFSKTFRRNVTAIIACCLAMFVVGLFYVVTGNHDASTVNVAKLTGLIEPADAASDPDIIQNAFYADVPVASISDPIVLNIVPTVPQYYVALSLLGIIMTLLILNWFSRTRS